MNRLVANIETVNHRIHHAAQRAGRTVDEITLVAVTKTHSLDTVITAYQAGLRHFGENRVEEGIGKVAGMADWVTGSQADETINPPTWHFIGHLQSRKVGQVLGQFGLIHSVDTLKLAQRIHRLAERDDYPPTEILLECNVSGEATKSGFALNRWSTDRTQLNTFLEAVTRMAALDKIRIKGLMTMAPLTDEPEETRPVFKSLAALRGTLCQEMPQIDWSRLSMGMTDDFEVAIEEGATIIRVGRALFGERNV